MAFNLTDYETVEDRLVRFWAEHGPGARVETTMMQYDGDSCIFRAEIYFKNSETVPTATGYAHEIRSDRGVNATSFVENCETSAIGRALANCGYATHGKRPSREEMAKVSRAENPNTGHVSPAPSGASSNNYLPGALATDKQRKYIRALGKQRGLDPESLTHFIGIELKNETKDVDNLTIPEAKQIIDALKP